MLSAFINTSNSRISESNGIDKIKAPQKKYSMEKPTNCTYQKP